MSNKIDDLEPVTRGLCEAFMKDAADAGHALKVTHTLRTMDEQQALYEQGRSLPGPIVTNAKPGSSAHNYGAAFDVAWQGAVPYPPTTDPRWEELGKIGELLGLVWGGRWKSIKDRPHFERADWRSLKTPPEGKIA